MGSAYEHQEVVTDYLIHECAVAYVLGPFDLTPVPELHISSFGVIPKCNQPGKWRLIIDLSSPEGYSVNDGIDAGVCSLSYVTVKDIAEAVLSNEEGGPARKDGCQICVQADSCPTGRSSPAGR